MAIKNKKMTKNKKQKKGFAFGKLKFVMIGLIVSGTVIYLCAINTGAIKGYEIRKVENRISKLKKENEKLQIEEAELNSYYNIKKEADQLGMVKADNVVYINDNTQVAYGH